MSVPGMLIADRYRLVRQVGSGGMGVVWEAMDERLGRPVAVKQLRAQVGLSQVEAELAKNRAMREARITARLHHRYAVPVFDVVEHEGGPCLIMQFLPSMPLSAVLKEGGPLSVDEAARVGAQVGSALAAAHQLNIVHRDVKPGNILITDDGSALISDFGISHALGDATLTSTGMVHGTPAYLAPEVARGSESSFASDVYSLGATLYAALEGAPPFGTDQNSIALLHRVASGQFVPPERTGALTPLVTAMLAPDPADRPSMQQAASGLAALAAPPGAARPAANLEAATLPLAPPAVAAAPPPSGSAADPAAAAPAGAMVTKVAPVAAADPSNQPPAAGAAAAARTAPAPRSDAPRRRRTAALVLTLVLLAAAALGTVALLNGWIGSVPTAADRGPGSAGASQPAEPASTSSAPSEPASSPATTASAAPPSARPTPEPTTEQSKDGDDKEEDKEKEEDKDEDDGRPPRAAELAGAITSYYALVPGDTDAAWRRLTSGYQSGHAGGRSAFERFWGDVRAVSVSDVSGTAPDRAQATVTYTYRDGRVVREQTAYRLVEGEGRLKIAASTVLSSAG